MQMSRLYMSTNRKVRASQLRRDGAAMARAGFQDFADCNFELAEMLDPTPREEKQSQAQSKKPYDGRKGESNGTATRRPPTGRNTAVAVQSTSRAKERAGLRSVQGPRRDYRRAS